MKMIAIGLLGAIVIVVAMLTALVYGPDVEGYFLPVVSATVSDAVVMRDRLVFTLKGDKFRDCRLETTIFAWHYGGQLLPTELYYADTDKIFNPAGTAYSVADPPYHVRLYAILSRPVYGSPEAELSGVAYYRCHPLWLLHYEFTVRFVPPPTTDVIPRPSPVAPLPK